MMFEICWYDVLNPTMGFLDTQILKTHKQLVSYNYCQNTNLEPNLSKLLIECHVFFKTLQNLTCPSMFTMYGAKVYARSRHCLSFTPTFNGIHPYLSLSTITSS